MTPIFERIKKRDGDIVTFDSSKITTAISLAGKATGEFGEKEARKLMLQVLTLAHEVCTSTPEVEEIQDIVERVLLDSPFPKTAKAYILYREQHSQIRNIAIEANIDLVEQYIRKLDWKIKENSNMCYSLQGLNNYISSDVTGEYWLNRIYPPEIRDAHKAGDIHIHDLSQLSVYTYFGKEVIIAKHHGDILTLSFEQFYEMTEAKEELLNEQDNAWAKYPKDLSVMDKGGWTRVTRLVRKAKDKPMRFLKNRGGRSVIVTEDHPMITEQGETAARDVQIKEDRLFTVDMVNRLSREHLFSQERIDLVQEIRSKGFYGRDGDTPYFNGLPVSECADESDGVVHTLSFCAPRYIRLTEEFGFFVGLVLAEGYLTYDSKSYIISMNSRNKKDLERANIGLLQHGWSGVITHRAHDNMYEIRIRNRFLRFLFARVFQIRPGSRHKTLPVGILSYSQDFLRGIIAGVLDGDGAANGKTGIQLRMASRTLLEQLAVALPFIGLFPRDRNCEGVGTVREYAGRTITQNFPIYGLGFRKMDSVVLASEKYSVLEPSQKAWQDETVDAWHNVLNNAETDIPDEYIYDITTETNTLVVNGMWNHNCVGWDLKDLLLQGFRGVAGKVESAPPRHLRTALGQLVNFIYTLQGECYSDDTEVLTDNGWKLFRDLDRDNDNVYSLNPATKDIELQKPASFFEFENNGKGMIHFKNDEADLLVTPNHNMLISQDGSDATEYRFVKAGEWNAETLMIPTGGIGEDLRCIRMTGESIRKTAYTGKVYCVEVPNHTLYVRRNGKAIWCGNSAGAQAVSNFDTLLAPFVRYDGLNYKEVKQAMQEFVFNSNIPTRVGFQCMSEDTEILTPEGWMGYEDIEVGQTIKTFNVKTGEIENLPVRKVFSRHYEGEMYNLKNRIQDQLISPGHRVVRKIFNTDDSFVLEEIEKILEYKSPVILPITGKNSNPRKDISDEDIRLLAWIIAEGTKESSTKHRHCHRITIYQSRTASPGNYEEITALLDKRGCEYSVRDSTPAFGGSSCMMRLNAASSQKILDDLFKTRETIKFIPEVLKNMDRHQARVFLNTYLKADGFEGCKITTTDIDILNGLQQIAVDAEYGFTVMTREPTIGKKMLYVLRLIDHQGTSIMEIKKVDYSGIIWCPNTDNETVVARRNGKAFITGNTPFFNITMDLEVPSTLRDHPVIIGGEYQGETYSEYQTEMDIINESFAEIMMEGDATGRVFTFPIPTYNITKDFNWDNPNLNKLWVMTGKFGTPYFSNFVNSDMSPEDVRSMCCRLRLSNKDLMKRGGGLFGANPLTGCYDEETEILTEEGWKYFRDLSEGDLVFTLSEGNMIELHKPKRLFQDDYEGMMYNFNAKSLDLCVTPNHRMVVDKISNKNKRGFVEAGDFDINNQRIPKQGTWLGEEAEWFILPEIKFTKYGAQGNTPYEVIREPLSIDMDDWLRFFGFWLAEGSFDNENIAPSHGYRVFITQKKEDVRKEIEEVLDRLPFRYAKESNNYTICNKQLWTYLKQFGKCYEKHVPKEIKKLSKRQLNILFEWMVKGDGHVRKTTGQINYWTSSKMLAGDVQEIILKIGKLGSYTTSKDKVSSIKGREIVAARACYNVGVQISKHHRLRKHNIFQSRYAGKVYCCEVENNTVFVRRNGKVSWCGNSIGVVTVNLPRIGYVSEKEEDFFELMRKNILIAKDSLIIKRKILENFTEKNLYPYSKFYLRDVKSAAGLYWSNHFSTFGIIGMNEACLNFIGKDIGTKEGQDFSVRVMDFIRDIISEVQEETGDLFNLEATPAEGTSYRLAMLDKERFPGIICANENDCCNGEVPYYTNSTQLPVNYTDDIFETLSLQDELQTKYTGGCIEKGNKVITDKGAIKIEEIVNHFKSFSPIKALSYNLKTGQSEWDLITDAVTIDVAKHHKIKVVAERGIEITTSDWHPFFVMEKISFANQCPVCAESLKNVKAFAVHLRHSQTCREKYVKLAKYEVVEKRADELRKGDYILQNSQNLLPEKSSLDSDSAYLIGFFIGDGSISEYKDNRGGNNLTRYKTRFFSESKPVLDKIADILNRSFGCEVKPIQNDKRSEKLFEVSTSKKAVSDFLFQCRFFAGKKAYTISIPSEIKRLLSKENFYGFLAGLIDSDGHVDKRSGTVEYYTVSEKLADDIIEMSSIAGILVSKHRKISQRDNEADMYHVFISSYQATLAREHLPLQRGKGYVKEVLSDRLKRRLPVVRVLNTSKTEVEDNDFYDLTTEKNHNYLAGNNSFVFVHNTVLHVYLGEMVSDIETVKGLLRKIAGSFRLPYFTLTPTFSVCPSHGYLNGEQEKCPTCDAETEIYSRIVGYLRPVNQWNKGKRAEFGNRKTFSLEN